MANRYYTQDTNLCDANTGDVLRVATLLERKRSSEAAEIDGGRGIIGQDALTAAMVVYTSRSAFETDDEFEKWVCYLEESLTERYVHIEFTIVEHTSSTKVQCLGFWDDELRSEIKQFASTDLWDDFCGS